MNPRAKIGWVAAALAVCVSAVLLPRYVQLRRSQVRPAELYEVVRRQVSAMREEDFSGAYQQASGLFQRKVNLPQFIGMARSDFARISKAARVEFGPVERQGDCAKLRVYFIDRHGRVTPCVYLLVNEDKAWKIDNVRVYPAWSEDAQIAGQRI